MMWSSPAVFHLVSMLGYLLISIAVCVLSTDNKSISEGAQNEESVGSNSSGWITLVQMDQKEYAPKSNAVITIALHHRIAEPVDCAMDVYEVMPGAVIGERVQSETIQIPANHSFSSMPYVTPEKSGSYMARISTFDGALVNYTLFTVTDSPVGGVFKPLGVVVFTPIIDTFAQDDSLSAGQPSGPDTLSSGNHDSDPGPTLNAGANAFSITVKTSDIVMASSTIGTATPEIVAHPSTATMQDVVADPSTDPDLAVNVSVFMLDASTGAYDIPVVSSVPGTLMLTSGQQFHSIPTDIEWFVTNDFTATGSALSAGQYRIVVHRHEADGDTTDEPPHFANFTVTS